MFLLSGIRVRRRRFNEDEEGEEEIRELRGGGGAVRELANGPTWTTLRSESRGWILPNASLPLCSPLPPSIPPTPFLFLPPLSPSLPFPQMKRLRCSEEVCPGPASVSGYPRGLTGTH